jgi:hypothetical protein
MTNDEIIAELERMKPMAGGALSNELTALGEKIKADDLAAAPPPDGPPIVKDVPLVWQDSPTLLTCTMGNWYGEPDSYSYQWQRDGLDAGSAEDEGAYDLSPGVDVGHKFTCVVTATNVKGSASSTSNEVTVA